jgi:hypothetical protein
MGFDIFLKGIVENFPVFEKQILCHGACRKQNRVGGSLSSPGETSRPPP